jgi:hypothetical protein
MRGKLWFVGGLAVGFVLGARAGRERYEQLVARSRKLLEHPTVQEAAGVAQAQATRLYTEGRARLGNTRFGEKLHLNGGGNGNGTSTDGEHDTGGDVSPATTTAKKTAPTVAGHPSGANGTPSL